MLKKAGIAVAVAAAGLLALSPLAFADDVDQDSSQLSTQGEGEANGHNYKSGLDEQLICGENHAVPGGEVGPISPGSTLTSEIHQGGGACEHKGESHDQVEKQHEWEH